MSGKVFKLSISGFSQNVLNADFMLEHITGIANEIAAKAGDGYEATSKHGTKRALAQVRTETVKAMRDNSQNNTLLKAAAPLKVVADRKR